VIVYCRSGRRSKLALEALRAQGFGKLSHLEGDFLAWGLGASPKRVRHYSAEAVRPGDRISRTLWNSVLKADMAADAHEAEAARAAVRRGSKRLTRDRRTQPC
jgi:hypothetical protein